MWMLYKFKQQGQQENTQSKEMEQTVSPEGQPPFTNMPTVHPHT